MSGEQWFQLWLTVTQVAVGAAVTVVAVYIAAMKAFRSTKQHSIEVRSRQAAERLLATFAPVIVDLLDLSGAITYVLQPIPVSIEELQSRGVDVEAEWRKIRAREEGVGVERQLISDNELRNQVQWATLCFLDFDIFMSAVKFRPETISPKEIADDAFNAALYIGQVCGNLERYLRGEDVELLTKPTYWRIPLDEFAAKLKSQT